MTARTKNNINQQDRISSQQRERSVDKEWDGLLTSYHIIDIFIPQPPVALYNLTSGSHHRQKNNISQAASNPEFYIINNTYFFHYQSVNQLNIFQSYFTLARKNYQACRIHYQGEW